MYDRLMACFKACCATCCCADCCTKKPQPIPHYELKNTRYEQGNIRDLRSLNQLQPPPGDLAIHRAPSPQSSIPLRQLPSDIAIHRSPLPRPVCDLAIHQALQQEPSPPTTPPPPARYRKELGTPPSPSAAIPYQRDSSSRFNSALSPSTLNFDLPEVSLFFLPKTSLLESNKVRPAIQLTQDQHVWLQRWVKQSKCHEVSFKEFLLINYPHVESQKIKGITILQLWEKNREMPFNISFKLFLELYHGSELLEEWISEPSEHLQPEDIPPREFRS
jgi:hypothetical protein